VALDVRLYTRRSVDEIVGCLQAFQRALVSQAKQHTHTVMPGFTHLQVAQPVSYAHHCLAYVEMANRDIERLRDARKRVNSLPLGAAALAGTTFPIDRERVAKTLGFEQVAQNSLDAVSDRDYVLEVVHACSLIMMHLSRMAEELVLWMNPRFGFVKLPDRFCTGSSIMPQKKNPDVPELIRGKTGRVYGHLMALLTLMKGQALAYNKDNQEDKEPLFDTVDTTVGSLRIMAELVEGLSAVPERMRQAALEGYATATDLADYLVRKGLPFREAHEVVALAVKAATAKGVDLSELSLPDLQTFHAAIEQDVFTCLSLEGSLAARDHVGGTAPKQVLLAIARAEARLEA
jgi:argininosuccinate lyase